VPWIYPRTIGAVDANSDGRAEVFVKLSSILFHVGGQHIVGLFTLTGTRLAPVTFAGGGRLEFDTGGISRYGDGALCSGIGGRQTFVVRHIEQLPPTGWSWTERSYSWSGSELRPAGVRKGSVPTLVPVNDPRVQPFYELRCGTLVTS
jgi:hypothetical protein